MIDLASSLTYGAGARRARRTKAEEVRQRNAAASTKLIFGQPPSNIDRIVETVKLTAAEVERARQDARVEVARRDARVDALHADVQKVKANVSLAELEVLDSIHRTTLRMAGEPMPISAGDLGHRLGLKSQEAAALVAMLCRRGLVERRRSFGSPDRYRSSI
jgi:hypothetical protein